MKSYKLYVEDQQTFRSTFLGSFKNYSYLMFKISYLESKYKKNGYDSYLIYIEQNGKTVYEKTGDLS